MSLHQPAGAEASQISKNRVGVPRGRVSGKINVIMHNNKIYNEKTIGKAAQKHLLHKRIHNEPPTAGRVTRRSDRVEILSNRVTPLTKIIA